MSSNSKSIVNISTPVRASADFCLIPVSSTRWREIFWAVSAQDADGCGQLGTSSSSVSKQIADVQRLLKKSGLNYTMHSAGTTVGN